tara:strand:+ start:688 stop:1950 length:1263 start_codon:yes stop_codon:yes gene_type:complete
MKRTEVGLFVNGQLTRGLLEQTECSDCGMVTSGDADGINSTLNFTNSTGGTFTVTNSALLFNDAYITSGTLNAGTGTITFTNSSGGTFNVTGFEGFTSYWDSTAHNNIIASGDSTTHTMIPGTLGITGNTFLGSNVQLDGTLTVGVDDTGHDVKFFGATAGKYMLWDEDQDSLFFPDDTKIVLGTGADTEIQQTGSETIIKDASTGNIKLRAGTITMQNGSAGKTMGIFNGANKVELFYNNNSKFETTNTGVNVTGGMVATGVVQGGKIGNIAAPNTTLDIHHDPTSLSNDVGGGDVVTFGTEHGSDVLGPGKLMYLNSSGVWRYADADINGKGADELLAIALGTAVSDGLLIRGYFDLTTELSGSFVKGGACYVGTPNTGQIQFTQPSGSGDFIRVVGYGTDTANVIYFNPDGTYITVA